MFLFTLIIIMAVEITTQHVSNIIFVTELVNSSESRNLYVNKVTSNCSKYYANITVHIWNIAG